jgi:hypothetical protein
MLSSLQDVNASKKNKEEGKYDFMAVYLCLLVKYKPLKNLQNKIDPKPLTVLNSNVVNEFKSSTKNHPSYLFNIL